MDQEGGRRRSTRLAARGVASPKVESPVVKKTVKSTEKPKRAKRKPTEDVIDLPDSKKSKSEENSSDETDKPEESKTNNIEKIEKTDELAIPSLKKDNQDEDDIPRVTGVIVRKNTDESIPDSEKQDDTISDADDKKDVAEDSEESVSEEKQPETQESGVAEQQKNDVSQEKPDIVAIENNGDDKKTAESVKAVIFNNDNGFCVAAKDLVTSNGDTDAQINTANGEKEVSKPEAVEPIKVLHDNTNHVAENDLKSVTSATVNTTSNNDVSGVEQVEKEQDKVIDNANDDIIVSTNDSAQNVDQPSTILS